MFTILNYTKQLGWIGGDRASPRINKCIFTLRTNYENLWNRTVTKV